MNHDVTTFSVKTKDVIDAIVKQRVYLKTRCGNHFSEFTNIL